MENFDPFSYDHYIVAFSGGKDSLACFLNLLEIGIPKHKIELWHHLVDGREGSTLMDWPVTEDYCRKVAEAFQVKIFFSWKTGGFEAEMTRENSLTKPNRFEYPVNTYLLSRDNQPIVFYRSQKNSRKQGIERQSKHYGIYFSENKESTLIYGNITNSYYLKIKNPLILKDLQWNLSVIPEHIFLKLKSDGYDGAIWERHGEWYEVVVFDESQIIEITDDNLIECGISGGMLGTPSTRMKFPQVSPDLRVRWCSAYLKIDVCTASLNNQSRFKNSKTVVISGERAEESPARAKYKEIEPDKSDNRDGKSKRYVDHWRPVHKWTEKQIWDIIKRHRVNPHPAYRMGWGRLSCMFCIFGNHNQWKSAKTVDQIRFNKIATYERKFKVTIRRDTNIIETASKGKPYPAITPELIAYANKHEFTEPVFINDWQYPAGAFGDITGPS